jgi:ribosomal protein L11 methyltransferase
MDGKWIEIKMLTTSKYIDILTSILYDLNILNIAIEDPEDILSREQGPLTWDFADINILENGPNIATIKYYTDDIKEAESSLKRIKEEIEDLTSKGLYDGIFQITSQDIFEEDWANNWKKYYKPIKIGEHIIIKPLWEKYESKKSDVIIELDPGLAFGTGSHETTSMCLEALEKNVHKDALVYDIGTGSGILAIGAAKLGAKKVLGIDLDPVAVDSAKENVGFNKLTNIEILKGNLFELVTGKADIIVANIIAEIIISMAKDVKNYIKNQGLFICSGIIKERKDAVLKALINEGFSIIEENTKGEWVCIIAKLKGSDNE